VPILPDLIPMKIISLNVNGIRAAAKKGLFQWLAKQQAEVICLQEVRANLNLLSEPDYQLTGYYSYFEPAEKPGYSGVAIYCRHIPNHVEKKLGYPLADEEGRYIHVDYPHVSIASLYLPSGTSGESRQALKYAFLNEFEHIMENFRKQSRAFIICGDWNIAHKPIDLKNWKQNQDHSGFLPEERAWMDKILEQKGWVDAFRVLNQEPDQYTWWSNRGQAWSKNVGWRIDYQIVTPDLKSKIKSVEIYKEERFSDHAPLIVDYEIIL
jgi:exodeoxyribonuclease-3